MCVIQNRLLTVQYRVPNVAWFILQYVLNPTFTQGYITALDVAMKSSRAYDGTTYLSGIAHSMAFLLCDQTCVKYVFLRPFNKAYFSLYNYDKIFAINLLQKLTE